MIKSQTGLSETFAPSELKESVGENKIKFANKEVRIEKLFEVCPLAMQYIKDSKLELADFTQQINTTSGPFLLLTHKYIEIVQSPSSAIVVLDLNPFGDLPLGCKVKTIIFELPDSEALFAFTLISSGVLHYYKDLNLIKNGVFVQKPVDSCKIDFFKNEDASQMLLDGGACYFATSHGRIGKARLVDDQLVVEWHTFIDSKNEGLNYRDINRLNFQYGDAVVAKASDKRQKNKIYGFIDAQQPENYIKFDGQLLNEELNNMLVGVEHRIRQLRVHEKSIYCLLDDKIVTFSAENLKKEFTLDLNAKFTEMNYHITTLEGYKSAKGQFRIIFRDFDVLNGCILILANQLVENSDYFNIFLIKCDVEHQIYQFYNLEAKASAGNDIIQSQLAVQDEKAGPRDFVKVSKIPAIDQVIEQVRKISTPAFFHIKNLTAPEKIFVSQISCGLLNVQVHNELLRVSLSQIARSPMQQLEIQGLQMTSVLNQIFDGHDQLMIQSQLNKFPAFYLQLYYEMYSGRMSKRQLQIFAQIGYRQTKVSLRQRLLGLFSQNTKISFDNIECDEIPLSFNRQHGDRLDVSSKFVCRTEFNDKNSVVLLDCALCSVLLSKTAPKYRSNTLFVSVQDHGVFFIEEFNKHVFINNLEREGARKLTLQENFLNYLRNEEIGGVERDFKQEDVGHIMDQIANRPIIDLKADLNWFANNGHLEMDSRYDELLRSYCDANQQKIQELIYFVHFVKELDFYDRLSEKLRSAFVYAFDALNGVEMILQYLTELNSRGQIEDMKKIEKELISVMDVADVNTGRVEKLSNLETLLSKVSLQNDKQIIENAMLRNIEHTMCVNMFADYCDFIIQERINNSDIFECQFKKADNKCKFLNVQELGEFIERNSSIIILESLVKLYNTAFFFDYQHSREYLDELVKYANKQDQYFDKIGQILVRYHFYDHVLSYCAGRLEFLDRSRYKRMVEENNNRLVLVYSTELHDLNFSLTDRLAFYIQEHERLVLYQYDTKPSELEVENLKFVRLCQENMLEDCLMTVMPQEFLQLFKLAQIEEDTFSDLGEISQFGQQMKQIEQYSDYLWFEK